MGYKTQRKLPRCDFFVYRAHRQHPAQAPIHTEGETHRACGEKANEMANNGTHLYKSYTKSESEELNKVTPANKG